MEMDNQVLLISSIFPPQVGGPAIFTSRFSEWLLKNEVTIKILSYTNTNAERSNKIHLISLKTNRLLALLKFIYMIKKYSNKETLILSNGAFIETYLACLFTKRKYVIKIPGDPVWELSTNRKWTSSSIEKFQYERLKFFQLILRTFFNLSFKNARTLVAPSQQLADFAENWGVDKNRIELIYNCVDSNQFKSQLSKDKNYDLVTVCRLVPWKGLEELISCATELGLTLAIIGDGPLMSHLQNIASQASSRIDFLGNIENQKVVEVLNASKIFILNSEYEATSYALIEAKMCGLPVIAKQNIGNSTVIRNNIDGFIVNHNSLHELKYSIKKLISDDQLRINFGEEARLDALIRFNQEINFLKIFNKLKK
jgi:glycosyltransferase involved in cell wall biosynthesis